MRKIKAKINQFLESNITITIAMSLVGVVLYGNSAYSGFLSHLCAGLGILLIVEAWALFVLKEIKDLLKSEGEDKETP